MDSYRLDNHKLHLHPQRVTDWLDGKNIFPLYIEVSPTVSCNHKCVFCAFDFINHKEKFLDTDLLQYKLFEMGRLRIKSIHFSGEGEPLLHPDIAKIVHFATMSGLDVGISTNAVMLTEELSKKLLHDCTWIKISFNAGTKKTYAEINGCDPADFDTVIKNLTQLVKVRDTEYLCTLGIQMVVLPENESEIYQLAKLAKGIGLDYVIFKPYSHNPYTKNNKYKDLKGSNYLWSEVKSLENPKFKVEVRPNAFNKSLRDDRPLDRCLALPFWAYINTFGGVWGCYRHLGDERFCYGSIYGNSFEEIWNGNLRKKCLAEMESFNISECGTNCRMDEINKYLWELKNPGRHVNFI